MDIDLRELCGWQYNPAEVERICQALETPFFSTPEPDPNLEINLLDIFAKVAGFQLGEEFQKIGDCTSWGWRYFAEILNCVDIYGSLKQKFDGDELKAAISAYEFQTISTEAFYGIQRVLVGGQRGSMQDGGVGAWCAKTADDFGYISRPHLKLLGLNPDYDPRRAKEWGAHAPPQNVIDASREHTIETVSKVRNFKEAAWHIQNGRPVPVCSNVGFEGSGGKTQRDQDGYCRPGGSWAHCMCFVGVVWKPKPGLIILNQWPKGYMVGPPVPNRTLPYNTWIVESHIVDIMLGQGDSYTGDKYKGYPARDLTDWRF